MTVAELIAHLQAFERSAQVIGTWEGVVVELKLENVYRAKKGYVVIDTDENSYRDCFEDGGMPCDRVYWR